ncbi:mechanosensitive ion channel family protein [Yunchengibacter salinarum]|uniref:mechanosensitive ion channel family protein n=1 Tax=Yunchengibacter salinarum TaxID=3133399 RepID=UPI0035B5F1B7
MQARLDQIMAYLGKEETINSLVGFGLSVLGALLILVIGFWLAGRASNWTLKLCRKARKMDETLALFFAALMRYAVITFTLVAVLEEFGVETTSFIAVLGALGLAIGLSLQGTLSHVAAGVMLLLFRPFKVGEYIEAGGHAGTITAISLFTTEMDTPDNVRITVPNGMVWGSAIKNYNFHDTRRCDLVFGIGYGDDIGKAMDVIRDCIKADGRALTDPETQIIVTNLGDNSVDITARIWCNSPDYWPMKFSLTRTVKEAFDRDGIEIPFPQRAVTMVQGAD